MALPEEQIGKLKVFNTDQWFQQSLGPKARKFLKQALARKRRRRLKNLKEPHPKRSRYKGWAT